MGDPSLSVISATV